jgi:hypothetical protein
MAQSSRLVAISLLLSKAPRRRRRTLRTLKKLYVRLSPEPVLIKPRDQNERLVVGEAVDELLPASGEISDDYHVIGKVVRVVPKEPLERALRSPRIACVTDSSDTFG